MDKNIYAVILAGGQGTRFWPLSRKFIPKQFLKITGSQTLLQATYQRIIKIVCKDNIYVITGKVHKNNILDNLKKLGLKKDNIIIEPSSKNTAAAIGLASKKIHSINKCAILVVLSSDHLIKQENIFTKSLKNAIIAAKRGGLITFGIKPGYPEINYGYIKCSNKRDKNHCFKARTFLEKPIYGQAVEYLKQKGFYWNSGIFVWKVESIIKEIRKFLPKLYKTLNTEIGWNRLEPISIDKGVLEKSKKIKMLPLECGWSDLGNLSAIDEVFKKDSNKNIFKADVIDLDSSNITVLGRTHLIATVGLKDLFIVDMPDVLFVCAKDKTNRIKDIIKILRTSKRKEHLRHIDIKKTWKNYPII